MSLRLACHMWLPRLALLCMTCRDTDSLLGIDRCQTESVALLHLQGVLPFIWRYKRWGRATETLHAAAAMRYCLLA